MATGAIRRVAKELKDIANKPIREFVLEPLESNMLEVHFTMVGPEESPYADGIYHGKVIIPSDYPFAPPDVVLLTPNGRFETGKRVCLSVSSYHPEHWKPAWGITTILHSLRSFMLTPGTSGIGSLNCPPEKRRELAVLSRSFKCRECGACVSEQWEETLRNAPPATDADKGELLPPPTPASSTAAAATPHLIAGAEMADEANLAAPFRLPPAGDASTSPASSSSNNINNNNNTVVSDSCTPLADVAPLLVNEESPITHHAAISNNTSQKEAIASSCCGQPGNNAADDEDNLVVKAATHLPDTTAPLNHENHVNDDDNNIKEEVVVEAAAEPPQEQPPVIDQPPLFAAPNNNNNNNRFEFEISVRSIDRALFVCLSICSIIILKKMTFEWPVMLYVERWWGVVASQLVVNNGGEL